MAKSRIGPFALESPLSAGRSSGQLFRAIHLEQRKLAALRVFPVPLGLTPASRAAFAEQLEQLKKLRHPAIVRCYGGGFDIRNAYLAYELIDGESLADSLARRGKLPWETALDACQQIADALHTAHQAEWVHGRLQPSKVLLAADGCIKITGFQRTAIASMIGSGPPSLNQLLYAAPELFRGQVADEKADLYSLGALMYSMLTGRPPVPADSIEQLAQRIHSDVPPSPSALVLDCPVWLNAIVEQLLSKDPKLRPFSIQALQLAFKEAQRRHSQGVGVLQHATAGFSPLQLKVDRAEAERVLGVKQTKKKRNAEASTPLHEQPWILASAFAIAIGAVIWFMLPLGEATLRARAEKQLASREWIDWNDARDKYLEALVERFPDGQHAAWAKEKIDWVDMQEAERRIERNQRLGRPSSSEAEKRYVEAKQFEEFGDRATALDKYRAIVKILSDDQQDRPIINLARRQIESIESSPPDANQLQKLITAKLAEAETLYAESSIAAAKQIWKSIVDLYDGNKELAPLVQQALARMDSLK